MRLLKATERQARAIDKLYDVRQQIKELQLVEKKIKDFLEEEFDTSLQNSKSLESGNHTVRLSKSLDITFHVEKLLSSGLDKELLREIIVTKIEVTNWEKVASILKERGVSKDEFMKCIDVSKVPNSARIKELFDMNELKIEDIEGCYEANIRKILKVT